MKEGNFLSETSYYIIKDIRPNGDIVANMLGNNQEVTLSKEYAKSLVKSAHNYDREEKVNQTELINIVLANPRTAMSIYFRKADKNKVKKVYEAEKATKIE